MGELFEHKVCKPEVKEHERGEYFPAGQCAALQTPITLQGSLGS